MADITKVKLGVCSVSFDGNDLGHTKGGVEVSYEPTWHDITVDKYGETVVEKVLIGEKITAKVPLAEYTLANLRVAMPAATAVGSTTFKNTLGKSAGSLKGSTDAAALVLHPIAESDTSFDVKLYKAMVDSQINLNHTVDNEKVIEVTFVALLDESKSDGAYLAEIGNPAAA